MRIVLGLGNPGPGYDGTRHNIGFRVIDQLAKRVGAETVDGRLNGVIARGTMELRDSRDRPQDDKVLLVKPLTYMNRSGEIIPGLKRMVPFRPEDLLVILDDMDLAFGHLRFRVRGGTGGHRGLASVLSALDTQDIPRLKVGVGRPPDGVDAADYLLQPFSKTEQGELDQVVSTAVSGVLHGLKHGWEAAMNHYNGPVVN